ncbi:MAG: Fe(3+) ABC transporter substrate-binding protein [Planctomycetota bacterium]|nr:Fe(3+) ABC transporter substrate-binding protein [Planctomycetota bacterium]MEE2896496.1 Fe(3+) ABC transporter substrate-binding protein [Planctomycetota bacterium]
MSHRLIAILLATVFGSFTTTHANEVVNVYSARHYDTDDELIKQFTAQTGIEVNIIEGKSDTLLARMRQEGDLSPADVFITVDAGRLRMAEDQGVFQPVRSKALEASLPASVRHPDGLWFGLTKRARVIVASKERVPADLELDYEDLVKPEWNGRVLIRSSANIYNQSLVASMIAAGGESGAEAWCRGLVANLARPPQGGDTDQIRAVAAGEGDVAIVNHYYLARLVGGKPEDREVADKVRVIFPNQDDRGTHVNICGAGVVKTAPNRENAIRFIEFLASEPAQRRFAEGNQEYPSMKDVPTSEILAGFGKFKADRLNASELGANNKKAVRVMDRVGWR